MSFWIAIIAITVIAAVALIARFFLLIAGWLGAMLDQHRRIQRQCRSGVISITRSERKAGGRPEGKDK